MSDMNFSLACVAAYIFYFLFLFFYRLTNSRNVSDQNKKKILFPKEIKKINQCSLPVSLIVLVSLRV